MKSSSSKLNNVSAIFLVCLLALNQPHNQAQAQTTKSGSESTPEQWLEAHNVARKEVGVPPLTWNESLVEYAHNYAETRVEDCELEHSMGPNGENLASAYENIEGRDAVKFWLTEKPDYDYDSNTCKKVDECGHYTQVVWKDTTTVGCARVKCNNNWMFAICSYYPPGNIEGQKPY